MAPHGCDLPLLDGPPFCTFPLGPIHTPGLLDAFFGWVFSAIGVSFVGGGVEVGGRLGTFSSSFIFLFLSIAFTSNASGERSGLLLLLEGDETAEDTRNQFCECVFRM